jgi:formylglycine-generating enzyme required for sulfatase activity
MMGRSLDGTDACPDDCDEMELPEHPAYVDAFYLDTFEVTVSRFRAFVQSFDGTLPPLGAGAHPLIPDSGWREEWIDLAPESREALEADLQSCSTSTNHNWLLTGTAGGHEAMNCVSWVLAFLFCHWDGGRLPTAAEWEFAAAGGDENRLYPWGNEPPTRELASYGCLFQSGTDCLSGDLPVVDAIPGGRGRWGHYALAGGVVEFVFDTPRIYTTEPCVNCGAAGTSYAELRGGSFDADPEYLRAAMRGIVYQTRSSTPSDGFRCARSPQ